MTDVVSPVRRLIGFFGLAVASFLGCIDLTIVTTAIPEIGRSLGSSLAGTQLTLGVFLTALAMFMITAGRLADILGRKRLLLGGLGLFVLASVGAALAPSIAVLIVFRFVQGAATAVLYTSTSTLVESLFPEGQRGRAIGWLYAVNGVGLAIGPVLGGLLVPPLGWEAIFWLNLPVGVIAFVAIAGFVVGPRPERGAGLDIPGQLALIVTVAAAVGVFTVADLDGWNSPWVIVSAGMFVVGLAGTVLIERRAAQPLLKPELFRNGIFVSALSADFFLALFYSGALLVIPTYLTTVQGFGLQAAGLLLLLVSATMALLSPQVGKRIDRVGPRPLLFVGFAAFTVSGAALALGAFAGQLVAVLVALVAFGVGWAFVLAPATVAAISSVPSTQSSFAVGASWTFHNFGGAVGAAVAAALFADRFGPAPGTGAVGSFLTVTSIVALVVLTVARLRMRTPGESREVTTAS